MVLMLPSNDSEDWDELRTVSSLDWELVIMVFGTRMDLQNPSESSRVFRFRPRQ